MSKKIISSVLFDFDGVLIDSLPAMEIAWNSVRSKYKIKNDFDQYKKLIGLPFQKILEELGIDSSKKDLVKKYYSKITSENIQLIKLNPYVENLLLWLSANSISSGIVTSKDKFRTYELVEYFQLNIQTIEFNRNLENICLCPLFLSSSLLLLPSSLSPFPCPVSLCPAGGIRKFVFCAKT